MSADGPGAPGARGRPPTAGGLAPAQERRVRRTVAGGHALLRSLAATWRLRSVDDAPLRRLRAEGRPLILSLWHGHLLPLVYHHRGEGVHVLISEHRDGEIIARIAERLGLRTVRGSTTRGGGRALLSLVRVLEGGGEIAVTPDGPRGPARRYQAGVLVAAQRAGVPIIPIGVHAARGWRLNSWDRFLVPAPFARITVAYGPPTCVEAGSPREAAAEAERFERLHQAAVARACEAAGGRPEDGSADVPGR